jgi:hypothetical protein
VTTGEAIVWCSVVLAIAAVVIVGLMTGHPEVLAVLIVALIVLCI